MDESTSPPSDIWSFRRHEDGWIWERVTNAGEPVLRSRAVFTDLDECIKDAARHGYVVTSPV